jgi:hypothetical protein
MIKRFFILLFIVLSISIIAAVDFGFDNPTLPKLNSDTTVPNTCTCTNVNATNYWTTDTSQSYLNGTKFGNWIAQPRAFNMKLDQYSTGSWDCNFERQADATTWYPYCTATHTSGYLEEILMLRNAVGIYGYLDRQGNRHPADLKLYEGMNYTNDFADLYIDNSTGTTDLHYYSTDGGGIVLDEPANITIDGGYNCIKSPNGVYKQCQYVNDSGWLIIKAS